MSAVALHPVASPSAQTEPLRVLHVHEPTVGGVPRYVLRLAQDQQGRGWSPIVAAPARHGLPTNCRRGGVEFREWTADKSLDRLPAGVAALRRIVREVDPDVLHLHSSTAGVAGRLAVRGRLPTIFTPHGWSFFAVKAARRGAIAWERRAAHWSTAIVCVSEAEWRTGEQAGIRAPWHVIRNGVDPERFREADAESRLRARARLDVDGSEPVVVCVGRITEQKGQDILLAAWRDVLRAVPDARMFLVGDGPWRPGLERRAVPRAHFVGEREDVADWLAAANVVALPSRWEGMSLALLEAMSTARSVVATDAEGMQEALAEGGGAVVPRAAAPGALAAGIVDRLRDPAAADLEGREGRRTVQRHFSLSRHLDDVASLAQSLAVAGQR